MPKTRKAKRSVLQVDSKEKIPKFELELKNSTINFVLVYADWCGACDRFKKNIWNPMCKGAAKHNRMAVRDDMIKNTSLSNANFEYLPTLLVVDEKGELQSFEGPDGQPTNAMPTPKNLSEMKRVVNVPVVNITNKMNFNKAPNMNRNGNLNENENGNENRNENGNRNRNKNKNMIMVSSPTRPLMNEMPNIPMPPTEQLTMPSQDLPKTNKEGVVYIPTPMVSPKQKGGTRKLRIPKFMRRFGLASSRRFKKTRKPKID
jgi:thiol-disulfide isomerase/thioredoxin